MWISGKFTWGKTSSEASYSVDREGDRTAGCTWISVRGGIEDSEVEVDSNLECLGVGPIGNEGATGPTRPGPIDVQM